MNSVEIGVLFKALSKILFNQDKIMKHFGVNRTNYDDYADDVLETTSDTEELANECDVVASNHLRSV